MNQKTENKGSELDRCYFEAETADQDVFAEMRSNLLLVAGDHYNKRQSAFFRQVRDSKQLSDQQKLRLTKNHIQKITKIYANHILSACPGVGFSPKTDADIHDQKSSELHHAVWLDAIDKYNLNEKIDDWCDDFVGIGEVATKIFWDPNGGKIKAYQQKVDEEGQPLFTDDSGEEHPTPFHPETLNMLRPAQGEPVYEGAFVFETLYGFNLLRSPEAKTMAESPYLIVRKMMNVKDLTARYPDQKSHISSTADRTMVVFDSAKGGYSKSTDMALVREHFYRPCREYPQGYFYIALQGGHILEEGPLPGGIFPIVTGFYEKIQTTPRGRSAVKQMRPYQAEINRSASKMAEHQITLGDDKIVTQNGSKITAGATLPGVRSINVTGSPPIIMEGRDGSQYLNYMNSQIDELYKVMMVMEHQEPNGQIDPYAMLFKAASQKKNFQRNIKRFERYLIEVTKLYLSLAKFHLPEDQIIYAVGKKEQVNIAEFKNAHDLCYEIKVEAQADDIETKFGKQLVLNHLVQYAGAQLSKEDLGKIIREMPYANSEEIFGDFTLDYDSAKNDFLALERGEQPELHPYDTHAYLAKRAAARMRQPDFKFLDPQIQQNYQIYEQEHIGAESERLKQLQMAESEFIPVDGYLVVVDMYVPDPADPEKTKRARIPYTSLKWLLDRLEQQGQTQEELETMNQGQISQMTASLSRGQPSPQEPPS